MLVRLLRPVNGRKKGEVVDIPVNDADRYLSAEFAEVAPEPEKRKRGRPRKVSAE